MRLLDGAADEAKQRQRLIAKYGWQFHMFNFMNRFSRNKSAHVSIEISPLKEAVQP